MLRALVGNFLDSLSEREFDAPLLAILANQGFYDIHFIHGGFEFGKDVIAKKRDESTGAVYQYAIQSKAGNIGQPAWREVRPQIEECAYNTRAHPSFDKDLPRVSVLVTTGRLIGAAPIDAQEYGQSREARDLGPFDIWDRETLLNWLCVEPSLGLSPNETQDDLLAIISDIRRGVVNEPMLERFSRTWLDDGQPHRLAQASIQASIICNSLRETQRLDLAALMALHLHRASWRQLTGENAARSPESEAAVRLFVSYASEVLDQVQHLLSDPLELTRSLLSIAAMVSYPAACVRLAELLGLLAIESEGDLSDHASTAVAELCALHPGSWRPPADQFAVSLIPPVVAIAKTDIPAATKYLKEVASWLLDRHDPNLNGLGLASLDEDEQTAAERLLAGGDNNAGAPTRQLRGRRGVGPLDRNRGHGTLRRRAQQRHRRAADGSLLHRGKRGRSRLAARR
ncbi:MULTISPECIES: hypothetical protein [unclassified Mycobacterium]|uniref:hypothetical protein n=1 Tax=unclassified Mycobacterium TaxID=2642494 RepID=UPI000B097937|nr:MULTISPECIES: hypothetical protein [unclassified Mycobacterium]